MNSQSRTEAPIKQVSQAARRVTGKATSARSRWVLLGLCLGLGVLFLLSSRTGSSGSFTWSQTWAGWLGWLGLGPQLEPIEQTLVEWRLLRTFSAMGVGALLAYSGALLQGVFRNDLASPGILGVSSGAALGASLAILLLGGYGPESWLAPIALSSAGHASLVVTVGAFLGAILVIVLVTALATSGGRISVPTLLLVGIALNALAGGLLAGVQSFVLGDYEIARAVFSWGFGTLEDRAPEHMLLLGLGLVLCLVTYPFVSTELDLFETGEDDALALGVNTARIKWLTLGAAAITAAIAVAVAGQIAFIGLVVPHLVRLSVSRSHRMLLPASLLAGALLLLGCDFAQRAYLGGYLRTGVLTSLLGGPFFLFLLARNKDRVRAW